MKECHQRIGNTTITLLSNEFYLASVATCLWHTHVEDLSSNRILDFHRLRLKLRVTPTIFFKNASNDHNISEPNQKQGLHVPRSIISRSFHQKATSYTSTSLQELKPCTFRNQCQDHVIRSLSKRFLITFFSVFFCYASKAMELCSCVCRFMFHGNIWVCKIDIWAFLAGRINSIAGRGN